MRKEEFLDKEKRSDQIMTAIISGVATGFIVFCLAVLHPATGIVSSSIVGLFSGFGVGFLMYEEWK